MIYSTAYSSNFHVFNFETYLEGLVLNVAKEENKAPHSKVDLNEFRKWAEDQARSSILSYDFSLQLFRLE